MLDFDTSKTDFFETVDLKSEQTMSLRTVLDHVLPKFGLTFQIRDEVLLITTLEKAANHPIRRVYRIASESESEKAVAIAEKLLAAFPERKLQVIPSEQLILVIGSEQQHFEVSKLLTLLLEKE